MPGTDRNALIRRLQALSTEKLLEIVRKRDASQWREEVFDIVERLLEARAAGVPPHPEAGPATPSRQRAAPAAPAPKQEAAFLSSHAVDEAQVDTLAIHCCDGRLASHFEDFLVRSLGLARCDRLAVPGGPALLAGRLSAHWEASGVENQVRFLVETHELRRVVLIAHQGCRYYPRRLGLAPAACQPAQIEDLKKAAATLKRVGERLEVQAFYAEPRADGVWFEPVDL